MKKGFILLAVLLLISVSLVIALENNICEKSVEVYYNPSCPHCQEITPLIKQYSQEYKWWKFNFYDVTQKNYLDVPSVPLVVLKTNDGRTIRLSGSYEIQKYLKCELQEMTTKECLTHLNLVRGSYFIE